ncbi:MAG: hypothetical protein AAF743_05565 [Planctomycetota bacterium]
MTLDYQNAEEAKRESRSTPTRLETWLASLTFLVGGGTALKALAMSNGALDEERGIAIFMLLLSLGLTVAAVVVAVKRCAWFTLAFNCAPLVFTVAAAWWLHEGW